jgi:two-component system response regulator AtoC/two-component system nitrogen regulation response regulator NtrX
MKMKFKQSILIADDDEKIIYAFKKTFEDVDVISTTNGLEALKILKTSPPTLAFVDITMPGIDGLSILKELGKITEKIPIVIITGYGTMQTAIDAVQFGAFDYITKPLDVKHIRVVAAKAFHMVQMKADVKSQGKELSKRIVDKSEIIGRHPLMQTVFKKIGAVGIAPNSMNVLITGESGTGKDLVAKAIHASGKNEHEPFIGINCSAIPENLLESEFFGYEKGAFTGAVNNQSGKFQLAESGTIFLDEIGDMPLTLQKKLLRVIEEREFSPLGSNKKLPVNARFITATNQDLAKLLDQKKFRKDLYYRLNVFKIDVPPLRKRKEDIPLLVEHFIATQKDSLMKNFSYISDAARQLLDSYDFPGNVRELKNITISAAAQETSDKFTAESLLPYLFVWKPSTKMTIPIVSKNLKKARKYVIDNFEEQFIKNLLSANHGHVTRAAKEAGIERQSFQRLMKKYGISSKHYKSTN